MGLTRISLIHSELETLFTLQVIWEIFPLHKNRNAFTFIVYSVLYIMKLSPWKSAQGWWNRFIAGRQEWSLTCSDVRPVRDGWINGSH